MILSGGQPVNFAGAALAEINPVIGSTGFYYAKDGTQLSGSQFAAYSALYRAQPMIASVVDKVATSAARLPIRVWDTAPAAGKTLDIVSAYARIVANPSGVLGPQQFYRWTFTTLEIYGEAFWVKIRDPKTGLPVELLPIHPARLVVRRDETGKVVYVYTRGASSAGIQEFPAADVVPFLRYNPDNLMRGMSRLEPLRSTLMNEDATRRAMESWWKRGARPATVLKHPGSLTAGAQARLRQQFDLMHAGADNFGGTAVLEEGLDVQVVQLSAEEMQYIEARKMNLQEVCMVYDVPPPVIHILDHATFSNITEQMRSMYRDTMTPRLSEFESVLDMHLRTEFDPNGTLRASFSLDDVLRGDYETRATATVSLVANGIMKPSEARPLFDLPDAGPIADQLYANAALAKLGAERPGGFGAGPAAGGDESSPGSPVPQAFKAAARKPWARESFAPTVRSVLSAVGREAGGLKAANVKAIRAALVAEHRKALGAFFAEQHDAVQSARGLKAAAPAFDPRAWDDRLTAVLLPLTTATAQAIGDKTAGKLGGAFDVGQVDEQLTGSAKDAAARINDTTGAEISAALDSQSEADDQAAEDDAAGGGDNVDDQGDDESDDPIDDLFSSGRVDQRTDQISMTRVAVVAGLSMLAAGKQNNAATKVWTVTSANPRPEHAAMDGEEVPLGEQFSNGMDGPGDYSGGGDEVANCQCELDFTTSDDSSNDE